MTRRATKASLTDPTDPSHELLKRAAALNPDLADRLVAWQRQEGRHHLPWQGVRDPYRVWLSEIMLQQTQVSTVLGYFDRFLARFPDVAALAAAPLDDVLTLWAGLGYYSRARNLHKCAQAVVSDHGGRFPGSFEALQTLPGIGPSTAAAIAAFCFDERVSIMDGNVKRVLSRALGWDRDLSLRANEKALWDASQAVVPARAADMPSYTQGLMDLGATLCTQRKPACLTCPWSDLCGARLHDNPERYPVKTRKLKRGERESWCLWIERDGAVWLVQRPGTGVWASLWTVPLFDTEGDLLAAAQALKLPQPEPQPSVKHVLTHLDWRLHPQRVVDTAKSLKDAALPHGQGADADMPGRWVLLSELASIGLPAPFRKLLEG